MKVNAINPDTHAQLASWMGYLRQAKKVTLQHLAQEHGTQRSNLSAFVTSGGQVRNVSMDKILGVLFDLGVLPNGLMTPGLHKWQVDTDLVPGMCRLLALNGFDRAIIFELGSGYGSYVVTQVAANILIFASLPAGKSDEVRSLLGHLGDQVQVVTLDRAGDAQIQSLWMTHDEKMVQSSLVTLMG